MPRDSLVRGLCQPCQEGANNSWVEESSDARLQGSEVSGRVQVIEHSIGTEAKVRVVRKRTW